MKKITSWVTDIVGILKITVRVNIAGTDKAFAIVNLPVLEGLTPVGDTITEAHYQELLNNINFVNNRVDDHVNDFNNPHKVTRGQLDVYSTGEIDNKLIPIEDDITSLEIETQRLENVKADKDEVSSLTKIDETTITRNASQELQVSQSLSIDTKVSVATFNMQMLEKLSIRPNGNDLLIVGKRSL